MAKIYDVCIVGAGPAGLTASIYASRYKLSNIVIGKTLGGELSLAHKIENYPGFLAVSGLELAEKWQEQAKSLGAEVLLKEVEKIEMALLGSRTKFDPVFQSQAKKLNFSKKPSAPAVNGKTLSNLSSLPANKISVSFRESNIFKIHISRDEIYQSKALIVATGSERRRLNIPGEKEYLGKGVSYCTTCDAPFFKGKTVALIGGSDSAVSGAVHTAEFADKVYLIYRKDKLRAEPMWQEEWEKIEKSGKGETIFNTNVTQILGGQEFAKFKVQSSKFKVAKQNSKLEEKNQVVGILLDKQNEGSNILLVDGIFIEIGGVPGTALVQPLGVELDSTGHIKVNSKLETNIKGLFAAGDMTSLSVGFKQAIWAMAQGAKAANSAYQFIKNQTAPAIRGI